jgi:hypothetical protein
VAVAIGLVWWVFHAAPEGSRRSRLDRRVGVWGQSQVARRWRPTYVIWLATMVLIVVLLVWLAVRGV